MVSTCTCMIMNISTCICCTVKYLSSHILFNTLFIQTSCRIQEAGDWKNKNLNCCQ